VVQKINPFDLNLGIVTFLRLNRVFNSLNPSFGNIGLGDQLLISVDTNGGQASYNIKVSQVPVSRIHQYPKVIYLHLGEQIKPVYFQ
jgi:hypothetical protein